MHICCQKKRALTLPKLPKAKFDLVKNKTFLMFTKLTYMKRVIILFLLISFCGGATDSSPPQQQEQQSQESSSENSSQESNQKNTTEQSSSSSNQESSSQSQSSVLTLQTLPDIKEFMTNKSDRFFVDFEDIQHQPWLREKPYS